MKFTRRFKAADSGTLQNIFVHEAAIRALTPTAAFVFSSIAFSIVKFGQATHSKRTISNRLCCTRKTVQLTIKKLIKDGWINEVASTEAPSGTVFTFGENTPQTVINSYRALMKKAPKNASDGVLIKVPVKVIDEQEKCDISRKKAARFRILSYLKMYIAYRNATAGMRTRKASCKFKNMSAVATHLNVTPETLSNYLDLLKEQNLIYTYFKGSSFFIDAQNGLMDAVTAFANNLKKVVYDIP